VYLNRGFFSLTQIRDKTILIVDDEPSLLMMMSEILKTAGFRTLTTDNGDDAEELLENELIDLILLDLVLPDRNGMELLECFRSRFSNIPIIMVTGFGKVEHAIKCFKKGATDFLPKPVSAEKLIATVQRILQSRQPAQECLRSDKIPRIPGYRFISILGEGNMGVVYHVERRDTSTSGIREYAMKVLKMPVSCDEELMYTLRKRFMVEAKAAFSIQHPNIIKIYDYGADETGTPFILMELFEGDPLDDLMQQKKLTIEEKCYILQQASFAVSTIHDNDICHRDIKPGNVLVDSQLTAKVMDFGIARLRDSTLTPTSHVFGTPAYLSPEAFSSARVNFKSDIFSFGSLCYELFTGERPFQAETVAGIANQIRSQDPQWPRMLDPNFPKQLDMMVKRMMEKDPNERYNNAFEIFEDFSQFLRDRNAFLDNPLYQLKQGDDDHW
jgi:serine/threonine protein kinase/CheY-like chemotaxis protein